MRLLSPFKAVKDEGGNVAIITALMVLPLTVLVGMSIDLSNASRVKVALQDAADSAALAMARNIQTITVADANTAATNYIDASFDKTAPFTATGNIDKDNLTVTVNATAQVPTTFAGLVGKTQIPVSAYSKVKGQGSDYEIVLVLDNSGSMTSKLGQGSTKIAELKTASKALLAAMLTTANAGKVKIGIVPFSSAVNVGTGNASAAWLDTTGSTRTSYHFQYLDATTLTRKQLNGGHTNGMKSTTWGGCVESRPIKDGTTTVNWDIDDTTPTTTKKDTLFTQWFAPDEPDSKDTGSGKDSYSNNYLEDNGGNCTGTKNTQFDRLRRFCKYRKETPNLYNADGPNAGCDTTAITPLTSTPSTLNTAIDNMVAQGNTNVGEGLAWGWRVISPTAPFSEAQDYGTKNLTKVIILMTDGQNNIPGRNNEMKSIYSSYGYMREGRLGTTSSDSDVIRDKMDERLALACTKIKNASPDPKIPIIIYTVALGADADAGLLKTCASKDAYAYVPTSGAELTPVFQAIAASITKLRLAE